MSEINFIMLNRFLDLKNLCEATKIMCLAHILKKILRILSFGGHVGRHLEYFNFPNDAKVASFSFNYGHIGKHIYAKTFCADYFWGLHPKSSFGNRTINSLLFYVHRWWKTTWHDLIEYWPFRLCAIMRPYYPHNIMQSRF